MNWFDFIGYAGALVIIFASTYTSIKRYRLYNVIGAGIFLVYGIVANIIPVIILMSCLMFINYRKMIKPMSQRKYYNLIDMKLDDPMLVYLLDFYKKEIKSFFPQFKISDKINLVKITMHDGKAVGFFLGIREDDKCTICLDYTIPKYRDSSVGKFLFPKLAELGIKKMVLEDKAIDHDVYLREMGFVKKGSSFVKDLED